ncbi:putative transmembrane protein [Gregarina niphandrodes]|uniref:Transmembrane protein n=1 Tax=Gregarina niphandrodes TaxID=110365 RepID=A0A023B0Y7_GRENI|nr:putative transmembrane protein [Gregarina niphandrodes]EZG46181.1 putative transmembrane protein [Gregarina niphandrodes]|eukprot:XP_011132342.1 putative transmembrane protein [Gregarina niphandrodes]
MQEEDVWLHPLDSRADAHSRLRCVWDTFVGVGAIVGMIVALTLLVVEDWTNYPVWLRRFVLCSMLLEGLIGLVAAASMACLAVMLGRNAMIHALSVISLLSDGLLSIAYLGSSVWSSFALYYLLEASNFSWTDLRNSGNFNVCLCCYVAVSWLVATAYSIGRLPVFFGVCTFALHQVERKIKHTPIVRFYSEYNRGDEYYIRIMPLEECSELVETMDNPLKISSVPEQQQPLRPTPV